MTPTAPPPAAVLAGLRDLHLPHDPGLATSPAGLALAAAVAALALTLALRYWRRRPLRRALADLAAAAKLPTPAARARAVSTLWRRHACTRYPAAARAGADEAGWADFLTRHGPAPAAALLTLAYRATVADADADALATACRRWLVAQWS